MYVCVCEYRLYMGSDYRSNPIHVAPALHQLVPQRLVFRAGPSNYYSGSGLMKLNHKFVVAQATSPL